MKKEKDTELSVDDQFLKDFVAKGGKAETASGQTVNPDNVDAFLEEVAATEKTTTPKQAELHKEAVKAGMGDTAPEEADKAEKEAARIAALQKADEVKRRGKTLASLSQGAHATRQKIVNPVLDKGSNAVDAISSLQTVGGIGLLLAILIFLLFVVVQVNAQGDTRLKQFWYMLNGRAKLIGKVTLTGTSGDTGTSSPGATATQPGTLPAPTSKPWRVNKSQFQADSAQLMRDLTIGNLNPDIPDQWAALNANFALQQDIRQGASQSQSLKDAQQLQQSLNKLNDPMYNSDYRSIYRDLGF